MVDPCNSFPKPDWVDSSRRPCRHQDGTADHALLPPLPFPPHVVPISRRVASHAEMSLSHHHRPATRSSGDPYYVCTPHPHPDPQRQGVLTLFVAGLPDDVKPREIHSLFSRRPGFDHYLFKYTGGGNQAVAFMSFFTHQAALSAMAALNGTTCDPESGDCLVVLGGDAYRVIDKRVNRTEGNAGHEKSEMKVMMMYGVRVIMAAMMMVYYIGFINLYKANN